MKNFSFCLVVLAITLTTAVQAAENKLFFHLAVKIFLTPALQGFVELAEKFLRFPVKPCSFSQILLLEF